MAKTLMIVDDSATMRKIIMRTIRMSGLEFEKAEEAANGVEEEGEDDVAESDPEQGHEGQHHRRGQGREGDVPASLVPGPVVELGGRLAQQVKLAVQPRLGLVHEMGRPAGPGQVVPAQQGQQHGAHGHEGAGQA